MTARRLVVALACVALAGCAGATPDTSTFPTDGRVDYQLGGAYDLPGGLDVVTRDSTAEPLLGAYSICYVNGFQTQPGDEGLWSPDLILRDSSGEPVIDPNWPNEFVLDPGAPDTRSRILDMIGAVIDRCRASGFDAVEIDNLDTYSRFPDAIEREAALDLARSYAGRAHGAGLAIGQKNSAGDAGEVGFDFATSEECVYFGECASYTEAYGSRTIDIEYTDALRGSIDDVCAAADRPSMTIVRDRDLVPNGSPGYFYHRCAPGQPR